MKRKAMGIICICLIMTMLFGCVSNKSASNAVSENDTTTNTSQTGDANTDKTAKTEIITAEEADIKSLDPHATNDIPSTKALIHIYNRLVAVNNDSKTVGDLAEKYEQISDTEWTFKLYEGVKFHDGTELKSSDVKFSIEREQQSPRVKHLVEKIKEVQIVDDYNFKLILNEPYAPLLANLAQAGSSILSEKAVTSSGDNYAENPVGTGPMKFVEWIPSDRLILERFNDYFQGPCKVERLVMRAIPEPTTRSIALETGEVDLAGDLTAIDAAKIEDNPDLVLKQRMAVTIDYIGFNTTLAPFDNILVRQAIACAIDKEALIDAVLEGKGRPAKTVMGEGIPGFYEGMEGFEYDVEHAKELLTEAGYPDGFTMKICTAGEDRNRACQLVQADLAKIGITLEIDLLEWAAFMDTINAGNFESYMNAWVNASLDPDGSLTPLFHSKNHGATGNRMRYTNKEVDTILGEAARESDNAKRLDLYKQAQEIIVVDCPWVPTYHKYLSTGIQKDLKGLELHPSGANRYENLYY